MADFTFAEWYARMGYHRHGGREACAAALGVTTRQISYLRIGDRRPDATLIKLCKTMELLDACVEALAAIPSPLRLLRSDRLSTGTLEKVVRAIDLLDDHASPSRGRL